MSVFENNRTLLDAFRKGEADALSEVYYHYIDDVSILVRRGFTIQSQGYAYVAGDPTPAGENEILQEVFLRAFSEKARHAFDGLRAYRPYLLRIAKNLLVDRLRKKKKVVSLDAASQDDSVGDIDQIIEANGGFSPLASRPEDDLHWRRQSAATTDYVAGLDEEQQRLITLRFEEDLSQSDVAEKMGVSRRRVRTLEQRIHKGLRKFLRQAGVLEIFAGAEEKETAQLGGST